MNESHPFLRQKDRKICVVGDGIAAWTAMYYLSQIPGVCLIQLSAPESYPACSDSSTATVARRATRKGLSELGDLIVDSFDQWEQFVTQKSPAGVERLRFQTLMTTKNKNRYAHLRDSSGNDVSDVVEEEGFVVNWPAYKSWLRREVIGHKKSDFESVECMVSAVNHNSLMIQKASKNSEEISFDRCLLCTGAFSHFLLPHYFCRDLIREVVAGDYLEVEIEPARAKELAGVYTDTQNLIVSAEQNKMMWGSSSELSQYLLPNEKKTHAEAASHWKSELLCGQRDLKFKRGLRQKGRKRMPYLAPIDSDEWPSSSVWFFGNLYKNGFLFSHALAKRRLLPAERQN